MDQDKETLWILAICMAMLIAWKIGYWEGSNESNTSKITYEEPITAK